MAQESSILQHLGISQLNEMQQQSIHAVLHSNRDVLILSPTGSGKTLAYLLPLVQRMEPTEEEVQAVVVVPGRELALQSSEVMKSMRTGMRSMAVYGGRPTMDEHREMRKTMPQIIFGTPGRINDHIDKENFQPNKVKWLIIDEFDKCLEMGFQKEMTHLVERLSSVERRILLSATMCEQIPLFVNMGRTEVVDFRVEDEQIADRIRVFSVMSPQKDKLQTLEHLLLSLKGESTVVFLNHRESVERVGSCLQERGFAVSIFHGGLEQKTRESVLYQFSNGSSNVLVCTDLASRGLDIPDIQNIIHYHLPETAQNYVHRVGRTARWDKEGRVFFLLSQEEKIPDFVEVVPQPYELPDTTGLSPQPARMVTLYIGKGKKDKLSKGDVVGFMCKKGGLNSQYIGRISLEERFTYVAVASEMAPEVLKNLRGEKIKGLKTLVELVR